MRCVVVAAIVLVGSAAYADTPKPSAKAMAHFKRGKELYDLGEYEAAVGELKAAFKIQRDPLFLYAIGQAYRMAGDCAHAVESFEAFLATNPPDTDQGEARLNIAQCGRKKADPTTSAAKPSITDPWPTVSEPRPSETRPSETRPSEPRPSEPRPSETRPSERRPSEPAPVVIDRPGPAWYTDVPGGLLAVGGIAGLAVGTTYLVKANHDVTSANDATSVAKLQHLADLAHRERTIGTIAGIAGGALAVGAIVRYVFVAGRGPDVTVVVDRTGGSAVWTARF